MKRLLAAMLACCLAVSVLQGTALAGEMYEEEPVEPAQEQWSPDQTSEAAGGETAPYVEPAPAEETVPYVEPAAEEQPMPYTEPVAEIVPETEPPVTLTIGVLKKAEVDRDGNVRLELTASASDGSEPIYCWQVRTGYYIYGQPVWKDLPEAAFRADGSPEWRSFSNMEEDRQEQLIWSKKPDDGILCKREYSDKKTVLYFKGIEQSLFYQLEELAFRCIVTAGSDVKTSQPVEIEPCPEWAAQSDQNTLNMLPEMTDQVGAGAVMTEENYAPENTDATEDAAGAVMTEEPFSFNVPSDSDFAGSGQTVWGGSDAASAPDGGSESVQNTVPGTGYGASMEEIPQSSGRDSSAAQKPGYGSAMTVSGICGPSMNWELADGVLTIFGYGAMTDYSEDDATWDGSQSEIRQVVISEGVSTIGRYAFRGCVVLETVSIPSTVTTVGDNAFSGCTSLGEFTVSAANTWLAVREGILFNKTLTMLIAYPAASDRTEYETPLSLTGIGAGAFSGAEKLVSISVSSGVIYLGANAFDGCTGLKNIYLPAGISAIYENTFRNCTSLKAVFYYGLRVQWQSVAVYSQGNSPLITAVIHCIDEPCILSNPGSVWVREGIPVAFGVSVWGNGLTYSWQVSQDGGATWTALNTYNRVLNLTADFDQDAWQYRCVIWDCYGHTLISGAAAVNLLGRQLFVETMGIGPGDTVYVDGAPCTVDARGRVILYNDSAEIAEVFTECRPDAGDPHTWYPTGMKVWRLSPASGRKVFLVEYLPEFDNLLTYAGISVSTQGTAGFQVRTGISAGFKQAVTRGNGQYTLIEMGTLAAWTDYLSNDALNTSSPAAHRGFAYSLYAVRDSIYEADGNMLTYTNVLTRFTDPYLSRDMTIRSFVILKETNGHQITIYGGPVRRSPAYIAWQLRDTFEPGSAADRYVSGILQKVPEMAQKN